MHQSRPVQLMVFSSALVLAGLQVSPASAQRNPTLRATEATQAERPEYFDRPVTDDEFRLSLDDETARQVDRLILQLSDPVYKTREDANEALIQVGAAAFSKLREAYHRADDLETRLRIEEIAQSAYVNHHVLDKHGFLGISMLAYDPAQYKSGMLYTIRNNRRDGNVEPPTLPEGKVGVFVSQVIEHTGAERAGLQRGDVIIAMNGKPVEGKGQLIRDKFSARIRKQKPGETAELTVVRGSKTLTLSPILTRAPKGSLANVLVLSALSREASDRFRTWWDKFFLNPPDTKDSHG